MKMKWCCIGWHNWKPWQLLKWELTTFHETAWAKSKDDMIQTVKTELAQRRACSDCGLIQQRHI